MHLTDGVPHLTDGTMHLTDREIHRIDVVPHLTDGTMPLPSAVSQPYRLYPQALSSPRFLQDQVNICTNLFSLQDILGPLVPWAFLYKETIHS